MSKTIKKPTNWRIVYAAVLFWLVLMIVLMRMLTKAYS
jgi:hypothetical protein